MVEDSPDMAIEQNVRDRINQRILTLRVDEVFQINHTEIDDHGGLYGVRLGQGYLRETVLRPADRVWNEQVRPDVFEMAAEYAFSIIERQPFVSQNERTAALSAELFLRINGLVLEATDDQYFQQFDNASNGTLTRAQLSEFLFERSDLAPVLEG
jgi:death-on-curing protein